jgi:formylglycine-generating enzyme
MTITRNFVAGIVLSMLLTTNCNNDDGVSTNTPDQYTLNISVTPSGAGTTTPSAGSHDYDENTVVTLIAKPSSGYRFTNWTGDVTDTSNDTTTVTMSADRSVSVHFTETTAPDIAFVTIPGGTFQMGDVEGVGYSGEKPVHTVTLTGFEMSSYEVTNAQYCAYLNAALASGHIKITSGDVYGKTSAWSGQKYLDMGYDYDSSSECWITFSNGVFTVTSGYENWPVVYVTWYGSKAFANYYSFDLPTESEWEYACRGGHQYTYGTDDGTISSIKANSANPIYHPVTVGSYPANPYGLYDMSGNVYEWCHDRHGAYPSESATNPTGAQTVDCRVLRGSSWASGFFECRAAFRYFGFPDDGIYDIGFRVVRRPGGVIY